MKNNPMNTLKKVFFISTIFSMLLIQSISSQDSILEEYRRSSLSIVLIDSDDFPEKETVIDAFNLFIQSDFPDKYNNFQIPGSLFDPKSIETTDEIKNIVYERLQTTPDAIASMSAGMLKDQAIQNIKDNINFEKLYKYFEETNYANQLVQKWFPYDDKEKMSQLYVVDSLAAWGSDITDIKNAQSEEGGYKSMLTTNASYDLVPKTYVVAYNLKFYSNEPVAAAIRDAAYEVAAGLGSPIAIGLAEKAADKIYEKTSIGYSVLAYAYLYQLDIDKNKINDFYENEYKRDSKELKTKFNLKWIGSESATALVTFSLKKEDKNRSENDIIFRATRRTIDNVFNKLQKKYDQFKPIFPLASVNPYSAYVGLKEGIDKKSKFEVYSKKIDKKTGEVILDVVGNLNVGKNEIWDNRFDFVGTENRKNNAGRTVLSGKIKNAVPGLLIKLKK